MSHYAYIKPLEMIQVYLQQLVLKVVIEKLSCSIYVGAYIALICGDVMISINAAEDHKDYNGRQSRYATTGVAIWGEPCACMELRYREQRRTETRDIYKRVVCLCIAICPSYG